LARRRISTQSASFACDANINGVDLPLFVASALAPAFKSAAAAAVRPRAHANMSGVSPFAFRAFTPARSPPRAAPAHDDANAGRRILRTSSVPSAAARCSAVLSVPGARTSSTASRVLSRRSLTMVALPPWTAARSGCLLFAAGGGVPVAGVAPGEPPPSGAISARRRRRRRRVPPRAVVSGE
jgi:hypothetical protein